MKIQRTDSNTYILNELSLRLRSMRVDLNWTQLDLAKRAGISLTTVKRMEQGESIGVDNLLNTLRALGCLENIDLLVPEQEVRPTDQMNAKQKKPRQRASKKQVSKPDTQWKWGDEQ